jgi:hypothetical protein
MPFTSYGKAAEEQFNLPIRYNMPCVPLSVSFFLSNDVSALFPYTQILDINIFSPPDFRAGYLISFVLKNQCFTYYFNSNIFFVITL